MVLQLPETVLVIGNRPSGRLSGGGLVNDFLKVKLLNLGDEFGAEIRILSLPIDSYSSSGQRILLRRLPLQSEEYKGGDQAIIVPGRPLLVSVCRSVAYFPNIFEKNPCFLTFSSRKDPSRFASACGAPPLPPLPPMRTISCRKGDFT